METAKKNIEIPLEFRTACLLNNVGMDEVLQAFVDHVSVYCFMGGGPLKAYSNATATLSSYNDKNSNSSQKPKTSMYKPKTKSALALKAIKQLIALSMDKSKTERVKLKGSRKLVDMLYRSVEQYTKCPEHLFLDVDIKVVFPKEFRLVCEIYATNAEEFISYFMESISLAQLRAHVALNVQLDNHPLFFLVHILETDYLKHGAVPLTEAMMDYIDEVQQLDAKYVMVRNLEKRIECYREFHFGHYQQLLDERG